MCFVMAGIAAHSDKVLQENTNWDAWPDLRGGVPEACHGTYYHGGVPLPPDFIPGPGP